VTPGLGLLKAKYETEYHVEAVSLFRRVSGGGERASHEGTALCGRLGGTGEAELDAPGTGGMLIARPERFEF
jgi:hypothetical protein